MQFFYFLLVCVVVLIVAMLKIMFDVKLHKLPMPKSVRAMAETLIDGIGLGVAATPAPVPGDGAKLLPKEKAA